MTHRALVPVFLCLATFSLAEGVDDDVNTIRGLGKEFASAARDFLSNPTTSAELARHRGETGEWVKGMVEKYHDAIVAKTAEGNKVSTAIKYLNEQVRLFQQKGLTMATSFAADFDGYVAKANKFADEAISKKAAKLFDGAWLQLGKAAAMVEVLFGFNGEDDTVKKFRARLDEARAAIAAKAWSIGDTSVLPARVVVRKDAETATIYMAYVNMDTASGTYDIGVKTKTSEYVIQDIAASKVK